MKLTDPIIIQALKEGQEVTRDNKISIIHKDNLFFSLKFMLALKRYFFNAIHRISLEDLESEDWTIVEYNQDGQILI